MSIALITLCHCFNLGHEKDGCNHFVDWCFIFASYKCAHVSSKETSMPKNVSALFAFCSGWTWALATCSYSWISAKNTGPMMLQFSLSPFYRGGCAVLLGTNASITCKFLVSATTVICSSSCMWAVWCWFAADSCHSVFCCFFHCLFHFLRIVPNMAEHQSHVSDEMHHAVGMQFYSVLSEAS